MCSSDEPVDGLALIDAGLSALADAAPGEFDGVALGEQLIVLHRLSSRLSAQFVRRVGVFHTRGDAAAEGCLSTQAFLTHRLRMSRPEAHRQVSAATALPQLPGTAAAYAAGDLSAGHVAVLSAGAERIGTDVIAAAEPILLQAAAGLDPGKLRTVVAHLRLVVDPDGAEADAQEQHERRGLWASSTMDGMVRLDGLLDPDTGEALLAALLGGPAPTADDQRTPAQRRADRLGDIVRAYLGSPETGTAGGTPVQVTLTAGLDTLQGRPGSPPAYLDWLGPIDLTTARLLACDCQITGIITTRDGDPLNVGWRHRTATPAQRAALALRDTHCQAPGCDRPASWCDAHHVLPWYHGGRTDLNNLVLLCRRHHRAVHHRIWRVDTPGGGRFRFTHISDRIPADQHDRQPRAG